MKNDIFNKIDEILNLNGDITKSLEVLLNQNNFKDSEFNILNKLKNIEQEKQYHPEGNVWNHTKMVVENALKFKDMAIDKRSFMWAALFHDIGKISTTKFIRGRYRSYNHDIEGEKVTYKLIKTYDEALANKVSNMVRFHMHHIYILKNMPFSDIDTLKSSENFSDIILLFICDKLGRGKQSLLDKKQNLNDVLFILNQILNNSEERYINLKEKVIKIQKIISNE